MNGSLTMECAVHFQRGHKGRKRIRSGAAPASPAASAGIVPRISRLMALAIRFEGLVQGGVVKDYAELARLGQVTRARLTQIMNLLSLAPDIQEAILFLAEVRGEREAMSERRLRQTASRLDWRRQRASWGRAYQQPSHKPDGGILPATGIWNLAAIIP